MPDITKCTGNCPISEYCYRYTAKPNPRWQSYSKLEEVCLSNEENKYSDFIPDEKRIKEDKENLSFDDILSVEIHKAMNRN
jgi:hypothetical protein